MNVRAKTSMIIIVTLILGIGLGVLLDRTIQHQDIRTRMNRMRNPRGFLFMLKDIIQPNAAQRDTIEHILTEHSERVAELFEQSRLQMALEMDSLRAKIDPLLTDEQKRRIEDRMNHFRDWRGRKPPFGPGMKPPFFDRRPHPPFEPNPDEEDDSI